MKIRFFVIPILYFLFIVSCYAQEGGVEKMILKNGLKVILIEDHSMPLVSVQTWVRAGSVNETESTNGLSHFLEHLIFKGTKKYPGQEITKRTETKGGVINAATSKEFTQFHIDIQSASASEALKILCDAMINASFPSEEIEKERSVVLEEIKRHSDNPGSLLYDQFSESVFLESAYRRSIIGSSDVIKNVSRDEIMRYYKQHYVPSNIIVSVAGDFKRSTALKIINNSLGREKSSVKLPDPVIEEPLHREKSSRQKKNVEHTYYLSGFVGPMINSDDQFAADIVSTILGGGRSSRLFRKLREEDKLVYSIGSSFWSQRGSGVFVVSAIFDPNNEEKTRKNIIAVFDKLMKDGPDERELKRAKEIIKSQWFFGRETVHDKASLYAYWELQNRPDMPDKYIESIEKVSAADIIACLKKYYEPQGLSETIIQPRATDKQKK